MSSNSSNLFVPQCQKGPFLDVVSHNKGKVCGLETACAQGQCPGSTGKGAELNNKKNSKQNEHDTTISSIQ